MAVDPVVVKKIREIVGDRGCLNDPADLTCYSFDLFSRGLPDLVVLPESTEAVSRVLAVAHAHGVPVTPRGSGTSLTGGPVPAAGGIALGMARMNRIMEISPRDRLARVQAGTVTGDLQRAVLEKNLFYPPNPTSAEYCTIGGNVATNAGGASGVKYGVTRDYLLGLTAVLPDGRILRTGSRCIKRVTGYDFTHFLCGSEGRLAVITEVTVRLLPPPESIRTLLAYFPTTEATTEAVSGIIESGIVPSTLELMDQSFLSAVADVYGLELPRGAAAGLLIELDGPGSALGRQEEAVAAVCRENSALVVRAARDEAEREVLWQGRRGGTAALVRQAKFLQTLDFSVPISAIPRAVSMIRETARRLGLTVVIIGHAGDGNLHPMFIYDPEDPAQKALFDKADRELCDRILSLGGTLSGEHGIGIEKAAFLGDELGAVEMDLSRGMKRLFDSAGILNPGKCEGACS